MKLNHRKAIAHLSKDLVLRRIIDGKVIFKWGDGENLFEAIVENIIGQQLSSGPVEIITGRFSKLFRTRSFPKPEEVLKVPDEKMRACGMSWAKAKYIKNLSQAVVSGTLDLEEVKILPDEETIVELTKVKGIGRWTAEMILIFDLRRPDVFSLGDLGLRTAVSKLYGVNRDNLKKIEKISLRWKPYRSLACRLLWRSLDSG